MVKHYVWIRFSGGTANNSTTHPYTATYRTDSTGRFDFIIEYPKANAHWIAVEVGAKTDTCTNTN